MLAQYGIVDQNIFTVKYQGQTFSALLGKSYSDVPKGEKIIARLGSSTVHLVPQRKKDVDYETKTPTGQARAHQASRR